MTTEVYQLTIEEAFGAVIRRIRRELNLSQEKLALDSGLDRSFLSNIEGGKQQPSLLTIFSIANAVNILPSTIFKEIELLLKYSHPDIFKSEVNRWEFDWVTKIEQVTDSNADYFKGTETVLIADDEIHIREMLSSLLTCYGYKVILANDGLDALDKYIKNQEDIKLLIIDIIMPLINGMELCDKIKLINPSIDIIITSGYRTKESDKCAHSIIVYKPFSPIDMLKVVRSTLDAKLSVKRTNG